MEVNVDPFEAVQAGLLKIAKELQTVSDVDRDADASDSVNKLTAILQDELVPWLNRKVDYDRRHAEAVEQYMDELTERVDEMESDESALTEEDAKRLKEFIESACTIIGHLIPAMPKAEHKMAARAIMTLGKELVEWADEITIEDDEDEEDDEEEDKGA